MDMHDRDSGVVAPQDEAEPYEIDGSASFDYPMDDYTSYHPVPLREKAVSGTQLRHRLITPEAIAAIGAEEPRLSLVQRLLKRLFPGR